MQLVSFDSERPAIFAFGATPVGVVAIGGFATGVVAIGIGAVGVLAIPLGAGCGAVSFGCGLVCGGFIKGVGAGLAIRASGTGAFASVWPEESFPGGPSPPPRVRTKLGKIASGKEHSGWVEATFRQTEEGPSIAVEDDGQDRVLPIAEQSVEEAVRIGRTSPRIVALVRRVEGASEASSRYREAIAGPASLVCVQVEALEEVPGPLGAQARWIGWLLAKLVALLAIVLFAALLAAGRIGDVSMTRRANATWHAKVRRAEGLSFPSDTECTLTAAFRGDGKGRMAAVKLRVVCGSLELYPTYAVGKCTQSEERLAPSDPRVVARLACQDDGEPPSEERRGRPGLDLDTGKSTLVLTQKLPNPFRVELAVDPTSDPYAPPLTQGLDR